MITGTSSISEKGQVTIPKKIRDKLRILFILRLMDPAIPSEEGIILNVFISRGAINSYEI
ncbi:MAG: hypothetical protein GF311_09880 [Candidatus Lokiarchaeota archaeon]|nr:hypothetical protein [Candidatus Lokiarchaeota archaeon]